MPFRVFFLLYESTTILEANVLFFPSCSKFSAIQPFNYIIQLCIRTMKRTHSRGTFLNAFNTTAYTCTTLLHIIVTYSIYSIPSNRVRLVNVSSCGVYTILVPKRYNNIVPPQHYFLSFIFKSLTRKTRYGSRACPS